MGCGGDRRAPWGPSLRTRQARARSPARPLAHRQRSARPPSRSSARSPAGQRSARPFTRRPARPPALQRSARRLATGPLVHSPARPPSRRSRSSSGSLPPSPQRNSWIPVLDDPQAAALHFVLRLTSGTLSPFPQHHHHRWPVLSHPWTPQAQPVLPSFPTPQQLHPVTSSLCGESRFCSVLGPNPGSQPWSTCYQGQ